MKTAIKIFSILTFCLLTGFTSKFEHKANDWKDFYIYVYSHDKNDYNKVYVSQMIHFNYESCGPAYEWSGKVEKSFHSFLTSKYNDVTPEYIYKIGSTTGNYLDSESKAKEKLNEFISLHKEKGHTIIKTYFNYTCN